MKSRTLPLLFPLISSFLILIGCSDIVPSWSGEEELPSLTLSYSEPVEFSVDLTHMTEPAELSLELVITYYAGMDKEVLPLFIVLENSQHNIQEFTSRVQLKSGGEWLGVPSENEVDYAITHIPIPSVNLLPDHYQMKIYADSDREEKIYGVVKIAARFLPALNTEPEEE